MKRLNEFAARIKQQEEEHAARMLSDPAYRAEVEAREADRAARYEGYEVLRREEQFRVLGLPDRLAALVAGTKSVARTQPVAAVDGWWQGEATFLVLGGDVGVGKTVAAAHAIAQHGGVFRKASQITRMSQFDGEAWGRLYAARLLVIDDLGTEPLDQGGWGLTALLDLFDRRYDDRARTLITTNLNIDDFRARYSKDGGRFMDRLREAGKWITVVGPSLRTRNSSEAA
jgi:DNA replication protein DnaC